MWPWRTASMLRSRPGPLPYHMEKIPSLPAVAERRRLLGAPDRGRGQILVDGRLEVDVGAGEEAARGPQLLVDVVHRGAAVAGDVGGGVEARRAVADALHHREAHQGLAAGDVNPSLPALVLVVQRHRGKLHDDPPAANGRGPEARRRSPGFTVVLHSTAVAVFGFECSPHSPPPLGTRPAAPASTRDVPESAGILPAWTMVGVRRPVHSRASGPGGQDARVSRSARHGSPVRGAASTGTTRQVGAMMSPVRNPNRSARSHAPRTHAPAGRRTERVERCSMN